MRESAAIWVLTGEEVEDVTEFVDALHEAWARAEAADAERDEADAWYAAEVERIKERAPA